YLSVHPFSLNKLFFLNRVSTCMGRFCKQVSHRLPRHWRIPCPVQPTPSELWSTAFFASTTCCFTENRLQVTPLAAHPAFHEIGRVFTQGGVEGVLGFRVEDGLDDEGELIV